MLSFFHGFIQSQLTEHAPPPKYLNNDDSVTDYHAGLPVTSLLQACTYCVQSEGWGVEM
jgi:hypothetical protein